MLSQGLATVSMQRKRRGGSTRSRVSVFDDVAADDNIDVEPPVERTSWWRVASYYWSTALLLIAVVFTYATIVIGDSAGFSNTVAAPPAYAIFFNLLSVTLLVLWSCLLEGSQAAIVGLSTLDPTMFQHSHPQAYRVMCYIKKQHNVERFILGRQLLIIFVTFAINRLAVYDPKQSPDFTLGTWTWNNTATVVLLQNAVFLTIVLAVLGSLVGQLVAAGNMAGFLELPFAPYWTVLMPSLALESTGLTHCSYVLAGLFTSAPSEHGVSNKATDTRSVHKVPTGDENVFKVVHKDSLFLSMECIRFGDHYTPMFIDTLCQRCVNRISALTTSRDAFACCHIIINSQMPAEDGAPLRQERAPGPSGGMFTIRAVFSVVVVIFAGVVTVKGLLDSQTNATTGTNRAAKPSLSTIQPHPLLPGQPSGTPLSYRCISTRITVF